MGLFDIILCRNVLIYFNEQTAAQVVSALTERSALIYGMPRAVKEAGLSSGEAGLEAMPAEILKWSFGAPPVSP